MKEVASYAVDAISLGSLYALFACGLALTLGVARIANFAYGDLMMVASYAILASGAVPWPIVVVFVITVPVALSLVIDRLAFRRVRSADGTTLLVIAFGVSTVIQNVALVIEGARSKSTSFGEAFGKPVQVAGLSIPRLSILTFIVGAVVLIGLTAFLRRSLVGMQLRAAAEDFTMSRLLGVRANRVIAVAFAISGAIAGIAALLLTMQSGSLSITVGLQPTLVAFVAVVVGGMGSLPGATIGGFLLGVLDVVLHALLPDTLLRYDDAILYSLIIIMLLARPQGLFGKRVAGARV
jgi:branched-chain amino acid transport system permease protein